MSKLKKAHLTEKSDWNYETLDTFNLLNELVTKIEQPKTNLYDFYETVLKLIKSNEYSEKQLILIILQKTSHLLGINLQVNRCVRCGNNKLKTISLKDHGMLCNMCFDPTKDKLQDLNFSKLIHFLFNEKYASMIVYANEWDYAIKLLKQFIADNAGLFFNNSITTY
jgi:DNA repair protein RecO